MSFAESLSGPLGQRLAWTLLHFVWQGFLIGGSAALVGWLLSPRQTRARYAVALGGLVLMGCCPLVTFAIVRVSTPTSAVVPIAHLPIAEPPLLLHFQKPIGDAAIRETSFASDAVELEPMVVAAAPKAAPREIDWRILMARRASAIQPYTVIAWLLGVVFLSARLMMSVLGVRRLVFGRLPVSAELAACAARLAKRLGLPKSPGVYLSTRIREAMLVGLWRPMVLLPAAWITEMPPDVLEAVIAHELAHVRRFDLWANLLQRLVETVLFYHPAVWWLSRRASLLREMCADSLAVEATGERMAYASTLELLGRRRLNLPQLAAGIGGRKMALFERVRNVLGVLPCERRRGWWPAGILALLAPLGLWLVSLAMAQSPSQPKPSSDPPGKSSIAKPQAATIPPVEKETNRIEIENQLALDPPQHTEHWLMTREDAIKIALLNGGAMRKIGAQVQSGDTPGIVLARLNTDIALATFERAIQDIVSDVDITYWELYFAYRNLDAAITFRNRSLAIWQKVHTKAGQGAQRAESSDEAQAREQYFLAKTAAEQNLKQLNEAEIKLRHLLGLASTDRRLIRPTDEPTTAKIAFEWNESHNEALCRVVELREARYDVKKREMEMVAARKYLLSKNFSKNPDGHIDEGQMTSNDRKELAGMRNGEEQLARARARLKETELDVSHQVAYTLRDVESNLVLTEENHSHYTVAENEVATLRETYEAGRTPIDVLLSAERTAFEAETSYYRALVDYARSISQVHYRKGSLLDYYNVNLAEGPWPGKAYYEAQRRAKVETTSVSFAGNHFVDSAKLKTLLKPHTLDFPDTDTDVGKKLFEEDVKALTKYYREAGFFRASVGRETDFENPGRIKITFIIDEGPRYSVRNLTFLGNHAIDSTRLAGKCKLSAGQFFDEEKKNIDVREIRDAYRREGYNSAKVTPDFQYLGAPDKDKIDLVYTIEEGNRYELPSATGSNAKPAKPVNESPVSTIFGVGADSDAGLVGIVTLDSTANVSANSPQSSKNSARSEPAGYLHLPTIKYERLSRLDVRKHYGIDDEQEKILRDLSAKFSPALADNAKAFADADKLPLQERKAKRKELSAKQDEIGKTARKFIELVLTDKQRAELHLDELRRAAISLCTNLNDESKHYGLDLSTPQSQRLAQLDIDRVKANNERERDAGDRIMAVLSTEQRDQLIAKTNDAKLTAPLVFFPPPSIRTSLRYWRPPSVSSPLGFSFRSRTGVMVAVEFGLWNETVRKQIKLTAEETWRLEAIEANSAVAAQQIFDSYEPEKPTNKLSGDQQKAMEAEYRQKLEALGGDMRRQIVETLTPEQLLILIETRKRGTAVANLIKAIRRSDDAVLNDLHATSEQHQKIRDIYGEYTKRHLVPDSDTGDKALAILTPEQRKKLDEAIEKFPY